MKNERSFFNAYFNSLLGSLSLRVLGIASTLYLVRILSPSDFGIVATATIIVGFFQSISQTCTARYLVLKADLSVSDCNQVWTLNIFTALGASILISLYTYLFVIDNNIALALYLSAAIYVVSSFYNTSLTLFEKQQNFKTVFEIQVKAKLLSTLATIAIAYLLQSFLALLIGNFINVCVMLFMSHSRAQNKQAFDHKIDVSVLISSTQFAFRNSIGYLRSQIDTLLVSKFFGVQYAGGYSVMKQFATLPETDLITPSVKPVLSKSSELGQNKTEVIELFYKAVFSSYLFVFPCALGFLFLDSLIVKLILGEQWLFAADIFGLLALLMIPFATQPFLHVLYDTNNKTPHSFYADLFGIVALIAVVYVVAFETVASFTEWRMTISGSAFVLSLVLAKYFLKLKLMRTARLILLPCASAVLMYFGLEQLAIVFESDWLTLLVNAALGAFIYLTLIFVYSLAQLYTSRSVLLLDNLPEAIAKHLVVLFGRVKS